MNIFKKSVLFIVSGFLSAPSFANDYSWHATLGSSRANFTGHTQNIWLNNFLENNYTIASNSGQDIFVGAGAGYTWNFHQTALNLAISGYSMRTDASGINKPFINGGNFDTLNYNTIV